MVWEGLREEGATARRRWGRQACAAKETALARGHDLGRCRLCGRPTLRRGRWLLQCKPVTARSEVLILF